MWSWITTLRKCFGKKREDTPPPELAQASQSFSFGTPGLKGLTEQTLTERKHSHSAGKKESQAPEGLGKPFHQDLGPAGPLPQRFLQLDDTQTGDFSDASSQQDSPDAAQEPQASSRSSLKPNVILDSLRMPLASKPSWTTGEGHTPLLKQPQRSEDKVLKPHSTPFELRIEQQLEQSREKVFGRRSISRTPRVLVQHEASPQPRTPELLPAKPASISNKTPLQTAGCHPSIDKENMNNGRPGSSATALPSKTSILPPVTPASELQFPMTWTDSSGGSLQTPSPYAMPQFVMDSGDIWGTPHVAGMQNPNTKYREDKRLRIHDTPFELRVEREMEKERIWKEQNVPHTHKA